MYGANVKSRLACCHCIRAFHWVNAPAPASYADGVVSENDRDVDNSAEEVADIINRGSDDSSDSN